MTYYVIKGLEPLAAAAVAAGCYLTFSLLVTFERSWPLVYRLVSQ